MLQWSLDGCLVLSSIPGESEADSEFLRQYLELVGHHPNQFLYHGRALVTTFAGDQCMFGQTSSAKGWGVARAALERVCPVSPVIYIHVLNKESGNKLRHMNTRSTSSLHSSLTRHTILG